MITFKEFLNERVSQTKVSSYNTDPKLENDFRDAVRKNDIDKVKELLQEGINPNMIDPMFEEPVAFMTIMNQYREILREFIRHGYDINLKDKYNATILNEAVDNRVNIKDSLSLRIVRDILEAGADIKHVKSSVSNPFLSVAINNHDYDLAKLLIEFGADINEKNRASNTPLMSAVLGDDIQMVELLLKHGADMKIKNKFDETALDMMNKSKYAKAYKEILSE